MTAATTLIFGFVYFQIAAASEAAVRVVLTTEAEKGVGFTNAELKRALDLRLAGDLRRLDYIALFDPSGRMLLGNISEMPAIPADGKAHFLLGVRPPGFPDQAEPAIFVARARPEGGVLLLGRSLVEIYALRRTVLLALVSAIGPMLLLALGIGAYFARRASRRLVDIHETIVRIMRGDLEVRLPTNRRPDEIDSIAVDVNRMLDEIVRLLMQVKNVSDNIAHDLRTPLAVMRAKLERGVESADSEELRQAARHALVELDKATRTMAALLRISDIEDRKRSSGFSPIDLAAICADVFEFYEPLGRAKSIAMVLDAQSPVPVLGDGDLMREAISNLIDNAIKFTPKDGAIKVSASRSPEGFVVRIGDSGRGVPAGEREKIFERFYRVDRNDRTPGSGLGLSIVSAIAKLHGLRLRVLDNNPGAVFEISGPTAT